MLDSKTICNSLLAMLERILDIKSSISKALNDCNQELETFALEKQEVDAIWLLVSSSEHVKFGKDKLDNRTSTLLSAEGIFALILNELSKEEIAI